MTGRKVMTHHGGRGCYRSLGPVATRPGSPRTRGLCGAPQGAPGTSETNAWDRTEQGSGRREMGRVTLLSPVGGL